MEGSFEGYRRILMQKRLSASVLLMAIPLYLGFSVLDYFFVPDRWIEFLQIRALTCGVFAGLALLFKHKNEWALRNVVALSHVAVFVIGSGISYMCFVTGGLGSPYYAGLNWLAIGSLAFWPGRARDRLISIFCIYGALLLMEVLSHRSVDRFAILSLVFMAGTCALSILNNALSLHSLEEEFVLRSKLQDLIRNKDQIIEIKSNETASLKRLAKQFSPAVIRAIESQTISLNERTRRKVATIFIDVVDSTGRAHLLDYHDYQKGLDLFFDIAIKALLAKNITVANFTGDGLMAIANAPYKLRDFEKVAFQTCLEIIDATFKKQRSFREYWKSDFAVRIGISSGYATVGFFPNEDFGIYTAIGESVSLGSRLCAAAQSFSIATTKSIITAAAGVMENCRVKKGGSIAELKGFAGHQLEFFLAMPAQQAEQPQVSAPDMCPLCEGNLVRASDLGDCVMLKCEKCHFTDIEDKGPIESSVA
jgi:class 3 adenylate cyclase